MQDQRYGTLDRRPSICLLVDVANIPEDAIAPLVQELRRRGTLGAMFAFGDWHRRDMHLRHRLLDALGFLCIHGGSWENGSGGLKSMVDSIMKRTIKWMPQWFPTCDTYVLATGDRDFSHDASDLRWRGFQVWIAAGEASINNELRLGADEFISLDRLPGRTTPAALLGVPPGYYEQSFGARRPMRAPAAPVEMAPPPRPTLTAPPPVAPAPVRPTPSVPARPAPSVPPVAPAPVAPVAVAPPAAVTAPVTDADDRALLAQIRELSGPRGYVAQREALRALAPADDPGGRVRSRLSNHIRDLIERNLLVRTHAVIGGNLTQVLALPGVAMPAEAAETLIDSEAGAERRGRRRSRRGGRAGSDGEALAGDLSEAAQAPVTEAPAAIAELVADEAPVAAIARPLIIEPAPVAEVAAPVEAPVPVEALAPVTPPTPVEAPAQVAPPTSLAPERRAGAPALSPERRAELRPEVRRVEAPAVRPAEPSPAPAPAAARPSWRDAVAAALEQVRGTGPVSTRPAAPPPAEPTPTPAVPPSTPPPLVDEPRPASAVAAPAALVGEAAPAELVAVEPVPADATEATAARRRRRRRPSASSSEPAETPAAAPAVEAVEAVAPPPVAAVAMADTPGDDAVGAEAEPPAASDEGEPARRRPARRRRRPAPSDAPPEPAAV